MGAERKREREREKSGTNPLLSDIYRVGIRNALSIKESRKSLLAGGRGQCKQRRKKRERWKLTFLSINCVIICVPPQVGERLGGEGKKNRNLAENDASIVNHCLT